MPGSAAARSARACGGSSLRATQTNSRSLASSRCSRAVSAPVRRAIAAAAASGTPTSRGTANADSTATETASSRPRRS